MCPFFISENIYGIQYIQIVSKCEEIKIILTDSLESL